MSLLKRDNFTLGQINEDVEYVIVSTKNIDSKRMSSKM